MKLSTLIAMLLLAFAAGTLTGCPGSQPVTQAEPEELPQADKKEQEVRTPINNEPQEIGERVEPQEEPREEPEEEVAFEADDQFMARDDDPLQRLRDNEPFEIPGMTFWDISSP